MLSNLIVGALVLVCGYGGAYVIHSFLLRSRAEEQLRHECFLKKQQAEREHADKQREEALKRLREPSRMRRQLAADLLFPGMYTGSHDEYMANSESQEYLLVRNWIESSTYCYENQRHLLLKQKANELEAEERQLKPRNHTLAAIAKNDPSRLRDRTVETEARKLVKNRARRKRMVKKTLIG